MFAWAEESRPDLLEFPTTPSAASIATSAKGKSKAVINTASDSDSDRGSEQSDGTNSPASSPRTTLPASTIVVDEDSESASESGSDANVQPDSAPPPKRPKLSRKL